MGCLFSCVSTIPETVEGRPPYEMEPKGQHKGTLIFMHGLGDQGNGWIRILSPMFNEIGMKVVCPNAASRPVHINFGLSMPSWFDLFGLSPYSPEDVEGINLATEYIHSLIKKEIDSGVNAQNIVVGGFSMGGALAIYSSLTYPEELLGGVVGLSAFLLQRDAVQSQCTANKLIPIFLGHGRNDPIVQCIYGRLTAQKIKQWNPNVVFKLYDCDHSTTKDEIKDALNFVKQKLNL